jgi:hypothetical protein
MAPRSQRAGLMVGDDFCTADNMRWEEVGDYENLH